MVEPKGGGDKLFDHLMPRISHVARRVQEAIDHGEARVAERRARGPSFSHGAIPLCLMAGYEDCFDDLKTHAYRTMIEIGEPDFFPVDDLNKLQPDPCRGCALAGPCPGLYRGYFDEFGADELRPIHDRPRSNSFNYKLEKLVSLAFEGSSHLDCPLQRGLGVTPWDRGRDLFVRNGPRVARFRTETRDFSDREISTIKHELGQVYLDASRKPAPDDFARDLVQLVRSPLCAECPERERCTGMFEPLYEDVFTRDDAVVRDWLAALRGDVLDVGCGASDRYDPILAPLAAPGRDPLRRRRARRRPGRRHRADPAVDRAALGPTLEALAIEQRFDHVLALRSWNHFADRQDALARLVALCRPGGVLTIVDNVAFGLVRTRAHARARRGRPGAVRALPQRRSLRRRAPHGRVCRALRSRAPAAPRGRAQHQQPMAAPLPRGRRAPTSSPTSSSTSIFADFFAEIRRLVVLDGADRSKKSLEAKASQAPPGLGPRPTPRCAALYHRSSPRPPSPTSPRPGLR